MNIRHILPFCLACALLAALVSCATPPASGPAPVASATPQAARPTPSASTGPAASPTPTASPQATPAASAAPASAQETRPFTRQLQVTYPDGVVSGTNEYDYDSQGRLVSDTEKNGSEIVVGQKLYNYLDGGITEIRTYDGNQKLKTKTKLVYANGLLMREEIYNDRDEPQTSSDYKYNDAGQKVMWVIQGKSTPRTASEYTWTNGRLTLITVFDATRTAIKTYKRSYSANGNIITEEEIDGQGALIRKTVSTWDGKLLVKEEVRTPQDAVQKSTVYSYDGRGLLVKTELYNRKGELIEIQNRFWTDLAIATPVK